MTTIAENLKVLTKEQVNKTDLMTQQNALMVIQNQHLRNLAEYTKRIDSFNRMVYKTESGYQIPEDDNSEEAKQFQEDQNGERDALDDMYFSDISTGGGSINEE